MRKAWDAFYSVWAVFVVAWITIRALANGTIHWLYGGSFMYGVHLVVDEETTRLDEETRELRRQLRDAKAKLKFANLKLTQAVEDSKARDKIREAIEKEIQEQTRKKEA